MTRPIIVMFGKEPIHIRDLWMEIFISGMKAHESWKNKSEEELQVIFDYWLKDKMGIV